MASDDVAFRLLRERVRALARNLPKAVAGLEEPVHQVRVASRRLRITLPLLAPKPDGKRVRRVLRGLRQITRAAGASRDLDVCVGLLEEHLGPRKGFTAEEVVIRRRLVAARGRRRRLMGDQILDSDVAQLRRDLGALLSVGEVEMFTTLSRLHRARDVGGAALLSDLAEIGERFDPPMLHQIRRQIRRMRYSAEVAAAFREESAEAPRRFKALQERLGAIHDAWMLSSWLARQAESSARRGEEGLAATARRLEHRFLLLGRTLHQRYLDEGPAEEVRRALALMGRAESAA